MDKVKEYRVYSSRWLVLGAYMLANLTIQILWISYAPLTTLSSVFYADRQIRFCYCYDYRHGRRLTKNMPIPAVQLYYGIAASVTVLLFLVFAR